MHVLRWGYRAEDWATSKGEAAQVTLLDRPPA